MWKEYISYHRSLKLYGKFVCKFVCRHVRDWNGEYQEKLKIKIKKKQCIALTSVAQLVGHRPQR